MRFRSTVGVAVVGLNNNVPFVGLNNNVPVRLSSSREELPVSH